MISPTRLRFLIEGLTENSTGIDSDKLKISVNEIKSIKLMSNKLAHDE